MMIVDSFAGGGGASLGIEMALGRGPDLAINHDNQALSMHRANHPETKHLSSNIYTVDPLDHVKKGDVGLAWFSPDCKHFSKAKGGKPVEKNIRDLAWVVVLWAERAAPDVIVVENVEEFQDWGPLCEDNRPIPEQRGLEFRRWVKALRKHGYKVEWRELKACDYGAPTIRKRLFVIARRDGQPIVWPKPTHGGEGQPPLPSAASIIDWSIPCPSIFLTKEEAKVIGVKRPLADATLRRIAKGVKRYVLDAANPFLVSVAHGYSGGRREYPLSEPFATVTAGGNTHALVSPTLIQTGYGERPGQEPRVPGLEKPLGTIVAGGCKHALVSAFLAQHNAGPRPGAPGREATQPLSTVTVTGSQQNLVAAHMMPHYGASVASDARNPVGSVTAGGGGKQALVAAHMISMHGKDRRDSAAADPLPTVTAGGLHAGVVAAFLHKYYGTDQAPEILDPMHTVTTNDRFGLVTVSIDGAPYVLADIGMRMLTPRELFRAQGFPDSYIIDHGADGEKMTKTAQTRMCGNSVCPPVAAAIVRANCADLSFSREAA